MLRANRRVLRPGGRLAFSTIHAAPGLDPRARRRAHAAGPPGVALRTSHRSLLASAGFVDVDEIDQTEDYHETQQAWLAGWERHQDEVRGIFGSEVFSDKTNDRRVTVAAIEGGLLRRSMYVATVPTRAVNSRAVSDRGCGRGSDPPH